MLAAELDGGGGDLHVTMPYSMIEPVREMLDAGFQSDLDDQDAVAREVEVGIDLRSAGFGVWQA